MHVDNVARIEQLREQRLRDTSFQLRPLGYWCADMRLPQTVLTCMLLLWTAAALSRPPVIDMHTHLDGRSADRIRTIMDRSGIQIMVNLSGGNPRSGMRSAIALSRAIPGRILNFYTPDFSNLDAPDWGVREAIRLRMAVRRYNYKGLKISKALGLYLRERSGVLIDIDDPRFDPLWQEAGLLGIPVAIHTGDPAAFWQPLGHHNERHAELELHPAWSFHGKDVPTRNALLEARNRVIDRHPLTTFICVHFGNNPEDPDAVEELLATWPNTVVDIAARVPELGRHPPDKMRKLIQRFSTRVLFGTDIGIGPKFLMLGSTGVEQPTDADAAQFYATHWRYLESNDRNFAHPTPIQGNWTIDAIGLPEATLQKVYADNARRLLRVN